MVGSRDWIELCSISRFGFFHVLNKSEVVQSGYFRVSYRCLVCPANVCSLAIKLLIVEVIAALCKGERALAQYEKMALFCEISPVFKIRYPVKLRPWCRVESIRFQRGVNSIELLR